MWSRIKGWFSDVFGGETNYLVSPLRGSEIDVDQLKAIEFCLKHFRKYEKPPEHFVYGHTHVQDSSTTGRIPVEERLYKDEQIKVHNVGAFYDRDGTLATFLVIYCSGDGEIRVLPHYIDLEGHVRKHEQSDSTIHP